MIHLADILAAKVESFQTTAVNFAKSRFLVCASEYGMNDKESEELMTIAESIRCTIQNEGDAFSLNIEYGDSPYLNIIEHGMEAPLTGGDGGIAHNPDGSTYRSNVPVQFQGNPIESFAKQGEDVMGEVRMMLTDLFRNAILEAVSESKQEIADTYRSEIQNRLGGGFK